jgi:hypothetical protein
MVREDRVQTPRPTTAPRRVPLSGGLFLVLALIALDLVLRWAIWRWWPWRGSGPGGADSDHLFLDVCALALWVASYVAPVRPRRRVFTSYDERDPSALRIGVVVALLALLAATCFTFVNGLYEFVLLGE